MRRSTRTLARSVLVGSCLVVALTARLAPAQDQTPHAQAEAAAQEEWTLTRLEIEPQETRAVALNQQHIVLLTAEAEPKAVPVVLHSGMCSYRAEYAWQGRAYEHSGQVVLHELRSQDPEVPHAWAVFSTLAFGGAHGFRLLAYGPGQNYLTWVGGRVVMFAEVSKPRDRHEALKLCWVLGGDPGVFTVPVEHVVLLEEPERRPWFGVGAVSGADITVLSLGKDSDGNWVLVLRGTEPEPVFALVSADGETWHLRSRRG
jgi:hypothetical protein